MPTSKYKTLTRLMKMREAFEAGAMLSRDELAEQHGVSTRTINRDIRFLQSIGVPLIFRQDGRNHLWKVKESNAK